MTPDDTREFEDMRARRAALRSQKPNVLKRYLAVLGVLVLGLVGIGLWLKPSPEKMRETVEQGLAEYARVKTEAGRDLACRDPPGIPRLAARRESRRHRGRRDILLRRRVQGDLLRYSLGGIESLKRKKPAPWGAGFLLSEGGAAARACLQISLQFSEAAIS